MTRILLLRHGFTENPCQVFYGPEFPLSPRGHRQIKAVADDLRVAHLFPDAVLASPFRRTKETAETIAKALDLPKPPLEHRLREWDVGPWFGKPLTEFHRATNYNLDPPPADLPPEIEPLAKTAARILTVIDEQRRAHEGGVVLLVSHREPLASALLWLMEGSVERIHSLSFPPACLWEIAYDKDGNRASIRRLFDHSADA